MADDEYDPKLEARRLLRSARVGTLATSDKGHPFASLVTPACLPDGSLAILVSKLSEHTRHLAADPRCSVMVAGVPETANPQTTPRVTLIGTAEASDDPALRTRFHSVLEKKNSLSLNFGRTGPPMEYPNWFWVK